jgi:hypothetical protein
LYRSSADSRINLADLEPAVDEIAARPLGVTELRHLSGFRCARRLLALGGAAQFGKSISPEIALE